MRSSLRSYFVKVSEEIVSFILLEKIGVIGAAISTLISYSFVGLFYDLFFKELRINFKLKLKSILFIN